MVNNVPRNDRDVGSCTSLGWLLRRRKLSAGSVEEQIIEESSRKLYTGKDTGLG